MGCLRVEANECEYKDGEWRLKEQFIYRIHDDDMLPEIIKEWIVIKKRPME